MKKFVAVLALTFALALVSHAETFLTGAYYTTKAPIPQGREAGQCDIVLFDNGTTQLDCYFNGEIVFTLNGTWRLHRGRYVVTAHNGAFAESPKSFSGTYKNGLLTGTWSIRHPQLGNFRGKWQATGL